MQGSAVPIAKPCTVWAKKAEKKIDTNGVISLFTNKYFLSNEEVTRQLQWLKVSPIIGGARKVKCIKKRTVLERKAEAKCTAMENDDKSISVKNV